MRTRHVDLAGLDLREIEQIVDQSTALSADRRM